MLTSSLFKRWIKRWRGRRRLISLAVVLLLIFTYGIVLWLDGGELAVEPVISAQWGYEEPSVEEIKDNTYFGLDESGVLSLYEGPPLEKNMIRSFFQLDVEFLESSLPPDVVKQLYEGILVKDVTEYNSVLSTFSDYAIDLSKEVIKLNEESD